MIPATSACSQILPLNSSLTNSAIRTLSSLLLQQIPRTPEIQQRYAAMLHRLTASLEASSLKEAETLPITDSMILLQMDMIHSLY